MPTERDINILTVKFLKSLGYSYMPGESIPRDYSDVILEANLVDALFRINEDLTEEVIREAVRIIKDFNQNNLLNNNKIFSEYLHTGIRVAECINEETKYHTVRLIDFDNVNNNEFLVSDHFTIVDHSVKRPDIIIFINGMPIVVFELGSMACGNVNLEKSYQRLKGYMNDHIPKLFYYNQFSVITDGLVAKAGTITYDYSRFSEWKKASCYDEVVKRNTYESLIHGMFDKKVLLSLLNHYILYSNDDKILSFYHQYYGVEKAIDRTLHVKDGRAGILWHTQGSGKSLSMVFYVANMIRKLSSSTVIVVTDRNDLDNQLYETFCRCSKFLRQMPVKIENRQDLKNKISERNSGGIIFTTLQKFQEATGLLSTREDILVVADEAHRSHYGVDAVMKFDMQKMEAVRKYGTAKYLHDAFPNATYIGFTGTPIENGDHSTTEVFGSVIDIYDMTQAIEDGSTLPILYESRMLDSNLSEQSVEAIDNCYHYLDSEEEMDIPDIGKYYHLVTTARKVLENPNRLENIVKDIIRHYEDRKDFTAGKAMVVASSRQSAFIMYQKFLELRPDYKDKVHMIVTPNNDDSKEMQDAISTIKRKRELEILFKDANSNFKIAIVVNMWLTGFDVPCLGTMYIDKPMKSHNLMQAIARVNRVYKDKSGGLIVDYVGLKKWLEEAFEIYTVRDQKQFINNENASLLLLDNLKLVRELFSAFDYSNFAFLGNQGRYDLINRGANFILAREETKRKFLQYSYDIKRLYSVCTGSVEKQYRDEILYVISVRSFLNKIQGGSFELSQINKDIANILESAINNDIGVVQKRTSFKLMDDADLMKLEKMSSKNVAVELLQHMLKEYIEQIGTTNIILMEKFSSQFKEIVTRYNERLSDVCVEQTFEKMIKLKNDIEKETQISEKYHLSMEEKAFYDVLSYAADIKGEMVDESFVEMARELTNVVNSNMTIDWDIKMSARAHMRVEIKKVLIRCNYPLAKRDEVVKIIVQQAELKGRSMVE